MAPYPTMAKRPSTSATDSMACRATPSSTPRTAAATAAMAALARLHRPGKTSRTASARPSAVTSTSPRSTASGVGRRNPQVHDQSPSTAKTIRPVHAGQPTASWRHNCPAATHTTRARPWAPHTTSGSSALATTTGPVGEPSAVRQRAATIRTSLTLSSWSRDRLSRTTTSGCTAAVTAPRYPSSTSSTAGAPGGADASAVASPGGRFAPADDVATRGHPPRAAASRRVVVVLPLVPVTRATRRPAARMPSRSGAISNPTRPPMTEPPPRCSRRDAALTAVDAWPARRARTGNVPSAGRGVTCRRDRAGRCAPVLRPSVRGGAAPRRATAS